MGAVSKRRKPRKAEVADKYELYEAAVQSAEAECDFIASTFKKVRRRAARSLREDFCGTASICCHWARRHAQNWAIGVDLDPEVLEWGRANRVGRLKPAEQQRVQLIESDVLEAKTPKVDVIGAFNFSYWIFQTRPLLRKYFQAARRGLVDDGLLVLDAFGGYEAFRELEESRKCDGFTYVWDQARYSPVTGQMACHIHFRFSDGSRMDRAFSYEWRLWTLPELLELLEEAGFSRSVVYWEGTDEEGEGDGEFTPEAEGEADAGWIAYIVAQK